MKKLHENAFAMALATTGIAALFILFWGLGSAPLLTLNEARRAVPVEGMFKTGNWLLPYLNGMLYIDKPPLFYWAAMLLSKIFSTVNEWTLRLPSALAACAIVLATFLHGKRTLTQWQALSATLILITCAGFVSFARRCEIEMLLTALCSGALFFAHDFIHLNGKKISAYASFLLMGAAILCKGPVALLFVHLPVLLMAVMRNQRATAFLTCWAGWLLLLVVGLSWYVVVSVDQGIDVWQKVYATDIQNKVSGSSNSNADPFYSYIASLLGDFFPWILLLLLAPVASIKQWYRTPSTQFFLIAAAVPLLVLSLFADKHAKYLLPAYPAFAILLGSRLVDVAAAWPQKARNALVIAICLLGTGYFVYFAYVENRVLQHRHTAMAVIQQITRQYPDTQLLSYKEVDMRSVYYHEKPIPVVWQNDINQQRDARQPVLLLLEKDKWQNDLDLSDWQKVLQIQPYIGRNQSAVVFANSAFVAIHGTKINPQ